ncbi:DNA polymerase III subunit delta' [Candidatus Hepatincolaceae symbiont of Richtersius coronifer]
MPIISHKNIINQFINMVNNDQLHQALIFKGKRGVGKFSTAIYFTKILLSLKALNIKGKGQLERNKLDELINNFPARKLHSNLLIIQPALDKKTLKQKDLISVEDIRAAKNFLNLKAEERDYKVIIIDSLDNLNLNAANALLKTIEEPNPNTIFFLIHHNEDPLLDTIKSRCLVFQFNSLNTVELKELCHRQGINLEDSLASNLGKLSGGSFANLVWYLQEDNLKLYKMVMDNLKENNPNNSSGLEKTQAVISYLKSHPGINYDKVFEILELYILKASTNPKAQKDYYQILNDLYYLKKNTSLLNLDKLAALSIILLKMYDL